MYKVIKEIKIHSNFKDTFFLKDCSLVFLESNLDRLLVEDIKKITACLSNPKKFITYDIGFQRFQKGSKSCRGVGWHVDGFENDYLMLALGDFRTQFSDMTDAYAFPEERTKLREFNNSIAHTDVAACQVTEIPNSTLVSYTSKDIHRGRVADDVGQRFFLRVCSSDYLIPKNKRLA